MIMYADADLTLWSSPVEMHWVVTTEAFTESNLRKTQLEAHTLVSAYSLRVRVAVDKSSVATA